MGIFLQGINVDSPSFRFHERTNNLNSCQRKLISFNSVRNICGSFLIAIAADHYHELWDSGEFMAVYKLISFYVFKLKVGIHFGQEC